MGSAELNCKWHFAPQFGGREDGPNDPKEENFKKNPYASLIRESIQNSLDVPLDESKPVRMEFSIASINANNYPNFFELRKHIEGCIEHFPNNEDAKSTYQPMIDYFKRLDKYDKLYYIEISDYNTKGMNYVKGDTNSPFYAFVRAAGVSSKSDSTAGGSFGYGKAAYFYISPLRTIIVSTKTSNDKCFFEGVSSLCTHSLQGQDGLYMSVGYYDNNNGEPVSNSEDIPVRFQRKESGTTILILGIDASDEKGIYKEMTEAVLRNFWMAIYKGRLEVSIDGYVINKENLPNLMEQYFPEEIDISPREKNYNPRPYLSAVMNTSSDNNFIYIERNMPTIGKVSFYMVKNKKATDKILYMRKPLMLVKAKRAQSSYGFYGVFICEDIKGNEYLRKTENPAHDEWKSANWRESGRRISSKGKEAIKDVEEFIKSAITEIFSNKNKSVQNIQGLEEFLYIPTAVEEDDEDMDSKGNEGDDPTTTITGGDKPMREDNSAIGTVMIANPKDDINRKPNPNGNTLSGHGSNTRRKKGGGGVSPNTIKGHYMESGEKGVKGNFLDEVPVTYRSFAQKENGQVVHIVVIHSDYEIEKGRIDLVVGNEQQGNDAISIERCYHEGNIHTDIHENSISDLHIAKGKNILKIKFADNMKHAVKLDAYEFK